MDKNKPNNQEENLDESEIEEGENVLKDMVSSLNELPTEVLEQLLKNLEAIEAYNKAHPEELEEDWRKAEKKNSSSTKKTKAKKK